MNEDHIYPHDIVEAMCDNCHTFYETTNKEYEDSYRPLCGECEWSMNEAAYENWQEDEE